MWNGASLRTHNASGKNSGVSRFLIVAKTQNYHGVKGIRKSWYERANDQNELSGDLENPLSHQRTVEGNELSESFVFNERVIKVAELTCKAIHFPNGHRQNFSFGCACAWSASCQLQRYLAEVKGTHRCKQDQLTLFSKASLWV